MTSPATTGATPDGVPVSKRSPSSKVMIEEQCCMRSGILKIMSLVTPRCFVSPLTLILRETARARGFEILHRSIIPGYEDPDKGAKYQFWVAVHYRARTLTADLGIKALMGRKVLQHCVRKTTKS